MLEKLGGKPPPTPTSAQSYFRDINPQTWQPILPAERPHPHASDANNSVPPFQRNLGNDVFFVAGWNLRLQANVRYRVTCAFIRNDTWPEIEIVLYERVPDTEGWRRGHSFGAVTSGRCASDFVTQVEEWLITVWGKHVIADNVPWYDFTPALDFDLDTTVGLLKLHFSAPNRSEDKNRLLAAKSSQTILIQVVE